MSFTQALSGLRSQGENIAIVSNNIANSQTVGFKNSRPSFADIFAGSSRVGLGTRVAAVMQDFRAGDFDNTGRTLDAAIVGQGFYRLEYPNGEQVVYSRNGMFNVNEDGFLINPNGQFLTGYGLNDPADPFSALNVGAAPERLQIPQQDMPANATENVITTYNLDSTAISLGDPNADTETFRYDINIDDPDADPEFYNLEFHYSNSFTTYDSLGNQRTVTTYYTKVGDNTWEARVMMDGRRPDWGAGATDENDADFTLNFDQNGRLQEEDGTIIGTGVVVEGGVAEDGPDELEAMGRFQINFGEVFEDEDFDGAAPLVFSMDLNGTTQFNNTSAQKTMNQDGYTAGILMGLEILDDGRVMRNYSNEERRAAGQIVLANFVNPEGLQPDGDNGWRQSIASGEPLLGEAGTGSFGTIMSETLESSNVDLAQELVNMIVAQRAYQANSSSISTQDELLQTVINL